MSESRLTVNLGEEVISPLKENSRTSSRTTSRKSTTSPPVSLPQIKTPENLNNSSSTRSASTRNGLTSRQGNMNVSITDDSNERNSLSAEPIVAPSPPKKTPSPVKAPTPQKSPSPVKAPVPVKEIQPEKVYIKKNTVTQMINDLKHLLNLNSKISKPNVKIRVCSKNNDVEQEELHSSILLARSNWFRRSWRNHLADEETYKSDVYTFEEDLDNNKNQFSLGIKLKEAENEVEDEDDNEENDRPNVPESINDNFEFELEYNHKVGFEQVKTALKEFKKFIYTSECTIREPISFLLLSLAELFQVETLTEYLVKHFKDQLEKLENNEPCVDNVLQILEITYNYRSDTSNKYGKTYKTNPEIDELLNTCIRLVNKNGSKYVQDLKFQELSARYPDLVLRLFCENPQ